MQEQYTTAESKLSPHLPISFLQTSLFHLVTSKDCRLVPGSEEYTEYLETGGPDESCLFDVYQIKCLPHPLADDCPENFWTNEDGYSPAGMGLKTQKYG